MDALIEGLRNRWPIISLVAETLDWLLKFFDSMHLLLLLFFAALIGQVLPTSRHDRGPTQYPTYMFAFVYIAHLWPGMDFTSDVLGVLLVTVRIVLASVLVHHVISVPAVSVTMFVLSYVQSSWERITQRTDALLQELTKLREERARRRLPEPPPPSPRSEIIRQEVKQARLDYMHECNLLREAGLDENELEAALESAKQKYLQRLHHALH
ncbi:MAG: hypothetical protein KDA93_23965 [Planctomycetaceae bacterium]|nr:hypothetical protein [Planctomycetaceae bacterium]